MHADMFESIEPDRVRKAMLEKEAWLSEACIKFPGACLPVQGGELSGKFQAVLERWTESGKLLMIRDDHQWTQGVSPLLLPALACAYRADGNAQHARDARRVFEAILAHERWHEGWQPTGKMQPLVVAHRLGATECIGWMGALPALLASEAFDDAFVLTIIRSAAAQLDYLSAHLHPGRNIRLTQTDALLHQSIRLSFLPQAARWRALAVHVLNDGFARLIAPDGASREATAWYHHILVEMAMRHWRLQQADGSLGLTIRAEKIAAMFDYSLACIEPDGRSVRMGDSVGNITPAGTLASFIAHRQKCLELLGQPTKLPAVAQCFAQVNQAIMRTGWDDQADLLAFDATARYGHHWHPGRNSLQLVIQGQRLLTDVGRMTYNDTPHRRYATSTRGHSTINFNGWDQADTPATLRHLQAGAWQVVEGDYQGGYWPLRDYEHGRGLYARHQRTVLWKQGGYVLVLDDLSHTAGEADKPSMEMLWHFAPGNADVVDARTVHARCGRASLHLHALLCPQEAKLASYAGSDEPMLGWIADDRTDQPVAAPSVMLRVDRLEPWSSSFATLLVPAGPGQSPARIEKVTWHDASEKPCAHVMIHWADGRRDAFWWTPHLAAALDDHAGDYLTDASLLHVSRDAAGQMTQVLVLDGSHASKRDGRPLVPLQAEHGLHVVDLK